MSALQAFWASTSILLVVFAVALFAGCLFLQTQIRLTRAILTLMLCDGLALLWALLGLALQIDPLRFGLPAATILALQLFVGVLMALSFMIFVLQYTVTIHRGADLARLSTPPIAIAALILSTAAYQASPNQTSLVATCCNLEPQTGAYLLLIVGMAVLLYSLYIILDSRREAAKALRLPTTLLLIGYGLMMITPITALGLFAAAAAFTWIARSLFMDFATRPLEGLSEELRIANRDLRQAIGELNTERRNNEALNSQLSNAKTYRSDFLAKMSHELRTPLNSIIGYSELLMSGTYGSISDVQSDRLSKIHRNGKSLLDVINDMLDLSKIDAGRLELDFQVFSLDLVLGAVVEELREQCSKKSLELHTQLEEYLPAVYGDHRRIQQILRNLTNNAVKFTYRGSVTLKVERVFVKKGLSETFKLPSMGWLNDGEWIVASIIDTGIGIAPEDQGRVFDEFWQVDNSHTREFEGPGLGLAIAKKLILLHDGFIWLSSIQGQGSIFYVALPTNSAPKPALNSSNFTSGIGIVANDAH